MPDRLLSFDELNTLYTETFDDALAAVEVAVINGFADGRFDRKRIEDIIFDLLTMYYALGWKETGLNVGEDIQMSRSLQQDAVLAKTAGETAFERIDGHITAAEEALAQGGGMDAVKRLLDQLRTVADTEARRTADTARYEAGEQYAEDHPEKAVLKQWVAIIDDVTRDTHIYLDGTVVPMDAYFYSYSGDRALFPHGFQSAAENANCRCQLRIITL